MKWQSMRNNSAFTKVNLSCESFSLVLIDLTLFDLVLKPDDLRDIWRDDTSLVLRFLDTCKKRTRHWTGRFGPFCTIIQRQLYSICTVFESLGLLNWNTCTLTTLLSLLTNWNKQLIWDNYPWQIIETNKSKERSYRTFSFWDSRDFLDTLG